jgi:anti-sigma-K factor RskA
MNGAGEMEREPEGDDLLAAEYVLGVQTAEERAAVQRRAEESRQFAAVVEQWEQRLWPLAADFPEVAPPTSVKARIDRLLFSAKASSVPAKRGGLWNSLAVWRTLALGALAGLLLVIALPFIDPATPDVPPRMVASLAAADSDVHYMAMFDGEKGEVGLSHISGAREQGHDFELWVIKGQQPPKSLGVVPEGSTARIPLPDNIVNAMETGDVFAISLEPAGGSPTGTPTGVVVAAGGLTKI